MSTYIDHRETRLRGREVEVITSHSWVEHTWLNLVQHYGPVRANRIIAGRDPATQADIARWNNLGQRSAA